MSSFGDEEEINADVATTKMAIVVNLDVSTCTVSLVQKYINCANTNSTISS